MTLRIFWNQGILDLWSKLAECRTFQERIFAVEGYLMPVASRAGGRTLIARTAHHMLDRNGAIRINEICRSRKTKCETVRTSLSGRGGSHTEDIRTNDTLSESARCETFLSAAHLAKHRSRVWIFRSDAHGP